MQAVILAGGKGSRLGELTRTTQKCLLSIDGVPVLGHIIDALVSAFGSDLHLIIGVSFQSQAVVSFVNSYKPSRIPATFVPHGIEVEGWEIYQGLESYITGPFVAMPGDVIALPCAYTQVLSLFLGEHVDAAMTLSPDLDVVDTHGVGSITNNRVVHLAWPPPSVLATDHMRDMTIWASDKEMFKLIKQYPHPKRSIGHVFMDAVRANRPIAGNVYTHPWIHIGYPHDLQQSIYSLSSFSR